MACPVREQVTAPLLDPGVATGVGVLFFLLSTPSRRGHCKPVTCYMGLGPTRNVVTEARLGVPSCHSHPGGEHASATSSGSLTHGRAVMRTYEATWMEGAGAGFPPAAGLSPEHPACWGAKPVQWILPGAGDHWAPTASSLGGLGQGQALLGKVYMPPGQVFWRVLTHLGRKLP